MCQCFNMLAVRGHGRGKRLGARLVLEPRASGVVSLQHVPIFHSASCERLNMLVVHRHGRGTRLGTCPSVHCICCGICCMRQWL